jgi:BirA family biotin operon repressor/biotin-[acetyl-CoA-carboxylase] ligase
MNLDVEILNSLRKARGGSVAGTDLSRDLGVSRAAIWARIQELRNVGYDIEASPHLGYRLLHTPDLLHADDLLSRLGKVRVIGRDIRVFAETTSTNDVVEKLARDGVVEGAVVFSESQTKGRGRMGRKWVSPAGKGLWFSILLRPRLRPNEVTRVTVASATALRRAIHEQTGLQADIKWPNDILLNGRKVAGILTELHAEVDQVRYITLGIGVDVNVEASQLPPEVRKIATSLCAELGRRLPRPDLAVAILRELDADYARITDRLFPALADEWEAHCGTIGRQVTIRAGHRETRGRAEALGDEGALLVRTEHGHLERIVGGDVTLDKNE